VTDGGGGTPADETTVTVALDGAPDGLQRYSVNVSATNGASVSSVEPVLITGNQFQVEDGGTGQTYVVARGADITGNIGAFQDQRTLVEVTFDGDVSEEDIELSVRELTNDNGNAMDPNRVTFSVGGQSPFTSPIGGGQAPPADPDDDGLYEDVNGDGQANFDDAISLAFVQTGSLTQEQVAALDFDGDGDIDFDDAVELAFTV
jgi:PKD repeat protein